METAPFMLHLCINETNKGVSAKNKNTQTFKTKIMQATTFNYAQNHNTITAANAANAIIRKESTQKIIMFTAILVCLLGAVAL